MHLKRIVTPPDSFASTHVQLGRQEVDASWKPRTTVTLPYINGLSEAVTRILTQLVIKVVFRPLGTLRHMLVHPKDPVPLDQQEGLCTPYLVTDAPRCTLDRLAKPSDIDWQSTYEP